MINLQGTFSMISSNGALVLSVRFQLSSPLSGSTGSAVSIKINETSLKKPQLPEV